MAKTVAWGLTSQAEGPWSTVNLPVH